MGRIGGGRWTCAEALKAVTEKYKAELKKLETEEDSRWGKRAQALVRHASA